MHPIGHLPRLTAYVKPFGSKPLSNRNSLTSLQTDTFSGTKVKRLPMRFSSQVLHPLTVHSDPPLFQFKTHMISQLKNMGLDPNPDTQFITVSAEQLLRYVAQNGFPERFTHWTWYQSFQQLHDFSTQHNLWFQMALEGVLQHEPPRVYIPEFFTPEQKEILITAGLIRTDFMRHNRLQKQSDTGMLHKTGRTSQLVEAYEDRYGKDIVEKWLDIALGFASLTDTSLARPPALKSDALEAYLQQDTPFTEEDQKSVDQLYVPLKKTVVQEGEHGEEHEQEVDMAVPESPEVLNNSPADPMARQQQQQDLQGTLVGRLQAVLPRLDQLNLEWVHKEIWTYRSRRIKKAYPEGASIILGILRKIWIDPSNIDLTKHSETIRSALEETCKKLEHKIREKERVAADRREKALKRHRYYYNYLDYIAQMYPVYRPNAILKEKADPDRAEAQLSPIPFENANERDGLGYLIQHPRNLLAWQRHILYKIREEIYFRNTQASTALLARGWTDFWTRKALLESHPVKADDQYWQRLHTYSEILGEARYLSPEAINDYAFAGLMMASIVNAASSPEEGIERIKHIRDSYDDYFFLHDYLTEGALEKIRSEMNNPAFCSSVFFLDAVRKGHRDGIPLRKESVERGNKGQIQQFTYHQDLEPLEKIKRQWLKRTLNCGYPDIALATTNFLETGHLLLYALDPSDVLNMPIAHNILSTFAAIWGKPVTFSYFRKNPKLHEPVADEKDLPTDQFIFITLNEGKTTRYTIEVDAKGQYLPKKDPEIIEPDKLASLQEDIDDED